MEAYEVSFLSVFPPLTSLVVMPKLKQKKYVTAKKESDRETQEWDTNSLE